MSVLYIVLPLALIVVTAAVFAYLWAAKQGQFDDLETPAVRALHDDDTMDTSKSKAPDARDSTNKEVK